MRKYNTVYRDAKQITERLNSGESTVTAEAKRYGCSRCVISLARKRVMDGSYYHLKKAHFTREDIDLIVGLHAAGLTYKQILEKFDDDTESRSVHAIAQIISTYRERPVYPAELTLSAMKKLSTGEDILDGREMFLINHKRGVPHVVMPLTEYLRLKECK